MTFFGSGIKIPLDWASWTNLSSARSVKTENQLSDFLNFCYEKFDNIRVAYKRKHEKWMNEGAQTFEILVINSQSYKYQRIN